MATPYPSYSIKDQVVLITGTHGHLLHFLAARPCVRSMLSTQAPVLDLAPANSPFGCLMQQERKAVPNMLAVLTSFTDLEWGSVPYLTHSVACRRAPCIIGHPAQARSTEMFMCLY